jgi:hypothetical protein
MRYHDGREALPRRAGGRGANDAGQLGDGSATARTTPTAVSGPLALRIRS